MSKRANCVVIRPMPSKDSGRSFEIDSSAVRSFVASILLALLSLIFVARNENYIVVELDGGQHAENAAADEKRSRFLEAQGYRVLRFWNHDVLGNTDGVLERIAEALSDPHPFPLPGRARVKKGS